MKNYFRSSGFGYCATDHSHRTHKTTAAYRVFAQHNRSNVDLTFGEGDSFVAITSHFIVSICTVLFSNSNPNADWRACGENVAAKMAFFGRHCSKNDRIATISAGICSMFTHDIARKLHYDLTYYVIISDWKKRTKRMAFERIKWNICNFNALTSVNKTVTLLASSPRIKVAGKLNAKPNCRPTTVRIGTSDESTICWVYGLRSIPMNVEAQIKNKMTELRRHLTRIHIHQPMIEA